MRASDTISARELDIVFRGASAPHNENTWDERTSQSNGVQQEIMNMVTKFGQGIEIS